jgi:hypothetical protein
MSASCPSCGSTVPPASHFCPQCGTALDDASKTEVIPPVGGGGKVRAAAFGDRVRGLFEITRTGAEARRRIRHARSEREWLLDERRKLLLALGEAVYAGDEKATSWARSELEQLDAEIAEREGEMGRVAEQAEVQVARTRLESAPTQVVPSEPMPPPGEADPPEPARVPEPYPPPGEADPPEPVRLPEPYPDPGEADPPEPARLPEPEP